MSYLDNSPIVGQSGATYLQNSPIVGQADQQPSTSYPPMQLNPLQSEAGYVLNATSGIPGINLLPEAVAGARGLYAGITHDPNSDFNTAFNNEYNASRDNQKQIMQQEQQDYPNANMSGKIGSGLVMAGLPQAAPTGTMLGDALAGGATNAAYGLAGGLGNGSSLDERLDNAGHEGMTNFAIGAPLSAVGNGLVTSAQGIKGLINARQLPAVEDALENNIPIFKNNVSDSKALAYLSSLSNEIPSVLGGTSGRVPSQQEAIAKALNKPIDESSGILNADTVNNALSTSGSKIGQIVQNNNLPVSPDLLSQIDAVQKEAQANLTGENLEQFNKHVDNLKAETVQDPTGNESFIPGPKYQAQRQLMNDTIMNNQVGSGSKLGMATRNLRETVDNAFQQSLSDPETALALQKARAVYSNASDLSNVTSDTRNPTGDFSFGSLSSKLGDNPNFTQTSNAAQLLKNQVGNSGTAERDFIINTAKGLGSAATGGFGLYEGKKLEGEDPKAALNDTLADLLMAGGAAGSIGGANRLFNPQITSSMLNGYQALQPVQNQAIQLGSMLSRLAPLANQSVNQGEQ